MSDLTSNMRIGKNKTEVSQGRLKCDIRAVLAVIFTLAAVMLMSTAVFAAGKGTKNDPYIVTDAGNFIYYCQQGGYIKVDAKNITIDNAAILLKKDVNIDLGNCEIYMYYPSAYNTYIGIDGANVTISADNGRMYMYNFDTNGVMFYVKNNGSLTLNGGVYATDAKRTISAVNSRVTINGANVDDGIFYNSELIVNNGSFGTGNYVDYPIRIENGSYIDFDGKIINELEISKETPAENVILRNGQFRHILVESSEYNISDLLAKGSYIEKNGIKVNANIKELTATYPEYYEIKGAVRILDVSASITEPQMGSTPDFSPVISTDGVTLYKTDPITWYKDGNIMSESDIFDAGHKYSLSIDLQAQDGYYFATDKSHKPAVSGTLNGTAATISKAFEQDPAEVISLSYDFGMYESTVTQIEVEITAPEAGKTPDFDPVILTRGCKLQDKTNGTFYNGVSWYDDSEGAPMSPTDTFVKGHDYVLEMYLVPEYSVTLKPKNGEATINRHTVDAWGANPVWISYKFKAGLMGDVDKNGFVEDADAALLMKYITGVEPALSELQLEAAKVTDSAKDKPDMLDVIAILKIAENS
ncbi:MAG: hypothetical protein IJR45_03230 [Firmicutes bacterium]|nr:hypothetical protein [Bacillota bacterium]